MATPYSENNPDHVPNPLYQSGIVDTTGTTGDVGARIENISPSFAAHKKAALDNALAAIDDPDVDENRLVVFHDGEEGHLSHEDAVQKLRDAAASAAADPQIEDPAQTPAAREAAETHDDEVEDNRNPASENSGASGPVGDPGAAEVEASGDGGSSDNGGSGDSDLPADGDSKAKWIAFAEKKNLDVDESLNKAEYVAAVKKANKA